MFKVGGACYNSTFWADWDTLSSIRCANTWIASYKVSSIFLHRVYIEKQLTHCTPFCVYFCSEYALSSAAMPCSLLPSVRNVDDCNIIIVLQQATSWEEESWVVVVMVCLIIVILYFVKITHRHGGLMKSTKLSVHTVHDMEIGNARTACGVALLPG